MTINVGLFCPNPNDSTSFYRAVGPYNRLRGDGHINLINIPVNFNKSNWALLYGLDVVVLQRGWSNDHLELCRLVKDLNIPLISDFDDDLLKVPESSFVANLFHNEEIKNNIIEILKLSDKITVSTKHLKESFSVYNKNIVIVENGFDEKFTANFRKMALEIKKKDKTKKLFVRCPDTKNNEDLKYYANSYNEGLKGRWDSYFLGGLELPIEYYKFENISAINSCEIIKYHSKIAMISPTVFHKPLADNPFNRCKSNIAYMEAALVGAAIIVPDWEEWNYLPETIKYHDRKSYAEALNSIVVGDYDFESMAARAYEYSLDNLSLGKLNINRLNVLKEVVDGH